MSAILVHRSDNDNPNDPTNSTSASVIPTMTGIKTQFSPSTASPVSSRATNSPSTTITSPHPDPHSATSTPPILLTRLTLHKKHARSDSEETVKEEVQTVKQKQIKDVAPTTTGANSQEDVPILLPPPPEPIHRIETSATIPPIKSESTDELMEENKILPYSNHVTDEKHSDAPPSSELAPTHHPQVTHPPAQPPPLVHPQNFQLAGNGSGQQLQQIQHHHQQHPQQQQQHPNTSYHQQQILNNPYISQLLPPPQQPQSGHYGQIMEPLLGHVHIPFDDDIKNGGGSCHQCKTARARSQLLICTRMGDRCHKRRCRKKFCTACLARSYGLNVTVMTPKEIDRWICPACSGNCICAACGRRQQQGTLKTTGTAPANGTSNSATPIATPTNKATPKSVRQPPPPPPAPTMAQAITVPSGSGGLFGMNGGGDWNSYPSQPSMNNSMSIGARSLSQPAAVAHAHTMNVNVPQYASLPTYHPMPLQQQQQQQQQHQLPPQPPHPHDQMLSGLMNMDPSSLSLPFTANSAPPTYFNASYPPNSATSATTPLPTQIGFVGRNMDRLQSAPAAMNSFSNTQQQQQPPSHLQPSTIAQATTMFGQSQPQYQPQQSQPMQMPPPLLQQFQQPPQLPSALNVHAPKVQKLTHNDHLSSSNDVHTAGAPSSSAQQPPVADSFGSSNSQTQSGAKSTTVPHVDATNDAIDALTFLATAASSTATESTSVTALKNSPTTNSGIINSSNSTLMVHPHTTMMQNVMMAPSTQAPQSSLQPYSNGYSNVFDPMSQQHQHQQHQHQPQSVMVITHSTYQPTTYQPYGQPQQPQMYYPPMPQQQPQPPQQQQPMQWNSQPMMPQPQQQYYYPQPVQPMMQQSPAVQSQMVAPPNLSMPPQPSSSAASSSIYMPTAVRMAFKPLA